MACGDGPDDTSLRVAWEKFCNDLKDAGLATFKNANPADPLQRADAFRFLTQNLGQAFDLALETRDPAFPQIHPFVTPTRKLGGDLADFTYRQAWIDGSRTYRITGRKGSARWLNVTVQGPRPATIPDTDWPSLHEPFGDIPQCNILGSQIKGDAQGDFELFVGGAPRPCNWLPTTAQSQVVHSRGFRRLGRNAHNPHHRSPRHGRGKAAPHAGAYDRGDGMGWNVHQWRDARLARTCMANIARGMRSKRAQCVSFRPDRQRCY
ncbi:hypothetical protein ACFSLT_22740 [Novosphingobium resinovorum]